MSDEFIDGDPYDPEYVAAAENAENAKSVEENTKAADELRRRKQAYANVFSAGETTQDDIDVVMKDLAEFCKAYKPTFDLNAKLQDLKEGRREVFMRIMDHTHLSHDMLFVKYTGAYLKQSETR